MEDSLASLNDWFSANALKVNASKAQLIVFGRRQNLRKLPDVRVSFRDAALQPCAQVLNLGVTFDCTLSWDAHVSELCRRCKYGTVDWSLTRTPLSPRWHHSNARDGPRSIAYPVLPISLW